MMTMESDGCLSGTTAMRTEDLNNAQWEKCAKLHKRFAWLPTKCNTKWVWFGNYWTRHFYTFDEVITVYPEPDPTKQKDRIIECISEDEYIMEELKGNIDRHGKLLSTSKTDPRERS